MKKYFLEWETVYGESDVNGTAIVEAETADEAKKKYEAIHFHTVVYRVTEVTESENENV